MSNISEAVRAFNVAKSNLEFARATKTQKRVIIAKDVIAAIRASWLTPKTGTYLEIEGDPEAVVDVTKGTDITECNACALGSVFVCAARRDQTIELDGDNDGQSEMRYKLAPYFDEDQLSLIETAFESEDYVGEPEYRKDLDKEDKHDRATLLGAKYEDADRRLIAIMKNVIANNGTFKP
ncbi:MAG TPA: hypothetical protein VIY48_05850 [Candidatus Paceibacterota bacterium]